MKALLTWITPRRRPEDDVQLADEGLDGLWWAEVDVTLKPLAATRMKRGVALEVAGLPAGVSGTLTRCGLTRAKLKLWGQDPEDIFDALVRVDLDAAQRLHEHARMSGMEAV
jgi:hypothetical protein